MKPSVIFFWFRRDLRLEDNTALFHALSQGTPVLPLFIFDRNILDKLENKQDRRVQFIYTELQRLQSTLASVGGSLLIEHGFPLTVWASLLERFDIEAVYANRDYEPYATKRDREVFNLLAENGVRFHGFKDQVIFDKSDVLKADGSPYTVFTPYSRKWLEKLETTPFRINDLKPLFHNFHQCSYRFPSLASIGFEQTQCNFPAKKVTPYILENYKVERDFPDKEATSRLSVHLRFGTISIRKLVETAQSSSGFLNELIWRDFFQMILYHFPRVEREPFKLKYQRIAWRNNEREFDLWCKGRTGYPLVDAGMRQLNATGWMHNRVRMVVASFLTKHLLVDWRWGEAYFAEKLLDFDLAANNGGWQWAAGTGCDAAAYFRIFNPYTQAQKFDPEAKYVKRWVTEYGTEAYPEPIVDHKLARERALKVYKAALNGA